MNKEIYLVCNGSGRMPCPENIRKYGQSEGWYGYRASDDTVDCTNCGRQYMYEKPTGEVNLRVNGKPCKQEYNGENAGRCYTRYIFMLSLL